MAKSGAETVSASIPALASLAKPSCSSGFTPLRSTRCGINPPLHVMQVREYQESDLSALRAIHAAQGFAYPLPDLNNPLFVTKLILSEEDPESISADNDGREVSAAPRAPSPHTILGAAFLRLTAEAYLLLDPRAGTPRQRWQWLLQLHAAAERDAWRRGLEDVHAWLPPPIAQKFGKRITHLGWHRDDAWTPYCKRLACPPGNSRS